MTEIIKLPDAWPVMLEEKKPSQAKAVIICSREDKEAWHAIFEVAKQYREVFEFQWRNQIFHGKASSFENFGEIFCKFTVKITNPSMATIEGCNHEPIPPLDFGPCGQPVTHRNRCGSCCDCTDQIKSYIAWMQDQSSPLITVKATDCVKARAVARKAFKAQGFNITGEVRVQRRKYDGKIISA